jgi:DNA repair protein RAD5
VNWAHVRLDGSMPQKARAAVLAEFTKAESFTDDDIVDSIMKTLLALVKLRPTPPARSEMSRTVGAGVEGERWLNAAEGPCRCSG